MRSPEVQGATPPISPSLGFQRGSDWSAEACGTLVSALKALCVMIFFSNHSPTYRAKDVPETSRMAESAADGAHLQAAPIYRGLGIFIHINNLRVPGGRRSERLLGDRKLPEGEKQRPKGEKRDIAKWL